MAIRPQPSFTSGELDPALHERTTLAKYGSGLATGRNVVVGKSGRLVSRPGRRIFKEAKLENRRIIIHAMSHNGTFLEWGHQYVKVWSFDGTLIDEHTHALEEDDLDYIEFKDINFYDVLILRQGISPLLLQVFPGGTFVTPVFSIPVAPTFVSNTPANVPAGYAVDYAITAVVDGQESLPLITATGNLPINVGETNTLIAKVVAATLPTTGVGAITSRVTELRVYRRPRSAGIFGFVGGASSLAVSGADVDGTFLDFGQDADYTHSPPTLNVTIRNRSLSGPAAMNSRTGTMYQQRLILSYGDKLEASRTGFPYNFYRDYPLGSDSSLSFKIGSRGYAEVLWTIDSHGLVVFTSQGIFLHFGPLSPDNLSLDQKGNWIIDDRVPPIAIPGGVLFIDGTTNTVRQLSWSEENGAFVGEELSIFNDHLFSGNRVRSWAFQEGAFPLLWVCFVDGTFATFTFEKEHKMQAWTRGDSLYNVEFIASTTPGINQIALTPTRTHSELVFVVERNGRRFICLGVPRYVSAEAKEADSEADKSQPIAAMDEITSWSHLLNDDLIDDDITVVPQIPNQWDGPLEISIVNDSIFTDPIIAGSDSVWRWFDPDDNTFIDLRVITRVNDNKVVVQPSRQFPQTYALNPRLYLTKKAFNSDTEALLSDEANLNLIDDVFTIAPVTVGVWDGPLTLSDVDDAFFTDPGFGELGTEFYYFALSGRIITLVVTARASDDSVTVQPDREFPSGEASDPTLWLSLVRKISLDHLEGEEVSIVSDGFVVSSPNNDIDNYPTVIVVDGEIELPNDLRSAILHVGIPYVADVETLDIDTVEQRPVLIESKTVSKVYVKVHNSRGLYVGNKFPVRDQVKGSEVNGSNMVALSDFDVDYDQEEPITGDRYDQPKTKRAEISLPGDWKSNGRVCLRQVDPLHFEILSIIPDIDDQRR